MELIRTKKELGALAGLRRDRGLALVPTMGALHAGHLSLVELAAAHGAPVVSIFVNPTQFGPEEDLDAYPRDLEADLRALRPLGVEAVFAPDASEMYAAESGVRVRPGPRAECLCGAGRPGHFSGVLTVVAKLFNLIRPDAAVFGRKDAQQCLVIAQMVDDLKMGIRLVDAPTVREADGLAMSSRNRYLDPDGRRRALALSRALNAGRDLIAGGERSPRAVVEVMRRELAPADSFEYAEVRSVPDLAIPDRLEGRTLLAVAARVEPARLIDNLVLDVKAGGIAETSLLGDEGETS